MRLSFVISSIVSLQVLQLCTCATTVAPTPSPCSTIQVCIDNCEILDTCHGNVYSNVSLPTCQSHLDDPGVISVQYNRDDGTCTEGTCYGIDYPSFPSKHELSVSRYTCNTHCPVFDWDAKGLRKMTERWTDTASLSFPLCHQFCFQTPNCLMWNVRMSGNCTLYTDCGLDCSNTMDLSLDISVVYTRLCKAECNDLIDPDKGQVSYLAPWAGEVAHYTCDVGYDISTNFTSRLCDEGGHWTESIDPQCIPFQCLGLSDPLWGTVDTANGLTYGQTAFYYCIPGFVLGGDANRTCDETGNWTGSEPTCTIVDCGTLSAPIDGSVDQFGGTTYLAITWYDCDTGYEMAAGSDANRTCLDNATWSGTEPTCAIVDCGPVAPPVDGSVMSPGGTTYGSVANYLCDTGYTLSISNSATYCVETGLWNVTTPTCDIVDCDTPTSPTDGSVSAPSTTYGSIAKYSCHIGHTLIGVSTSSCLATGFWNTTPPTCTIVDCGVPQSPVNGDVSFTGTTYTDIATFNCNIGYIIAGSVTTFCQSNGFWDVTTPMCDVVDCGNPSVVTNGNVDFSSGTTYDQTATYTCDTGYTLSGVISVTCLTTGNWNNIAPTCIIVDCGTPPPHANGGVITPSGTTYTEVATYGCNAGYTLVGSATSTCQATGVWSGSTPPCVPQVTASSATTYNPGVQYTGSKAKLKPIYIYPCLCNANKQFTGLSNEEIIHILVTDTVIDKKNTSLSRRSHISMDDERMSSQVIGYGGAIFLFILFGILVIVDLSRMWTHFRVITWRTSHPRVAETAFRKI